MEIIWDIARVMWGIFCLAILALMLMMLGWAISSTIEMWQDDKKMDEYDRQYNHCLNATEYGTHERFECFDKLELPE